MTRIHRPHGQPIASIHPPQSRASPQVRRDLHRALADGHVTNREANRVVTDAKKGGISVGEKRAMRHAFLPNVDRFDVGAQKKFDHVVHGLENRSYGEPAAMGDSSGARYQRAYGKLFVKGASSNDIAQGAAGDCYFLASAAAVAHANPKAIENLFHANKDGSVTVTLFQRRPTGQAQPVNVTVDRETVAQAGSTLYAHGTNQKELWPALLEKAYAKLNGNFDAIGNGGYARDAIFALTGKDTTEYNLTLTTYAPTSGTGAKPVPINGQSTPGVASVYPQLSPKTVINPAVLSGIQNALAAGMPVTTSSLPQEGANEIDAAGIVRNHEYTVLGLTTRGGEQAITLRNPWAEQEAGKDGRDDGVFTMKLSDFIQHFGWVTY